MIERNTYSIHTVKRRRTVRDYAREIRLFAKYRADGTRRFSRRER